MATNCELREVLGEIAELERDHNLLGARIAVKPGQSLDVLDAARYVLVATKQAIELLGQIDDLPTGR